MVLRRGFAGMAGCVLTSLAVLGTTPPAAAVSASPPPTAPAVIHRLIGEYRSIASETLTVYEKHQTLYIATRKAAGIALHRVARFVYADGHHHHLSVGMSASPPTLVWKSRAYERFDLGAERVAAIRAGVRTNVEALRHDAKASMPPDEPGPFRPFDLVALVGSVPNVKLDVRYATSDNFIGLPLYSLATAFLQRPAASALGEVARALERYRLGLIVFDGYRPWFVTKMFWDAVPAEAHVFVADPSEGSKHNRGCAVDLALYDLDTGRPIEMTGRYDEMSPRSYSTYMGGTSRERWYRDLLREEMQAGGFDVYPQEWWHFDFRDWRQYPIGNQAFENL